MDPNPTLSPELLSRIERLEQRINVLEQIDDAQERLIDSNDRVVAATVATDTAIRGLVAALGIKVDLLAQLIEAYRAQIEEL